jgi:hypothetical protein
MSYDPNSNDLTTFHNSSLSAIMGQGVVEWMSLSRSAQTRKKLKHTFPA